MLKYQELNYHLVHQFTVQLIKISIVKKIKICHISCAFYGYVQLVTL